MITLTSSSGNPYFLNVFLDNIVLLVHKIKQKELIWFSQRRLVPAYTNVGLDTPENDVRRLPMREPFQDPKRLLDNSQQYFGRCPKPFGSY